MSAFASRDCKAPRPRGDRDIQDDNGSGPAGLVALQSTLKRDFDW